MTVTSVAPRRVKLRTKSKTTFQREIQEAANALGLAAPSIGTGQGKTYEAWITLELAKALKDAGLSVEARSHADTATRSFFFRRNPGKIKSAHDQSQNLASHFNISGKWYSLEIHAGVQHRGVSRDLHEIDVSIVSQAAAAVARSLPKGGPYVGARWVALELKEFGDETFLDKGIPRALLGVIADLDPESIVVREGPSSWRRIGTRSGPVPHYALLTTAKIRNPSKSFLDAYGIEWAEGFNAREPIDALYEIIQRILVYLQH